MQFFAPWCGHCKALAPKYEKAASDLSTIDSGIKLASVDCTEEKDLCSKFDVKGYPTLKVFRKDSPTKPSDYKGGRETADIVKYMAKQNSPAYNEVTSQADVTALRNKADEVLVLGLFDSPTATDAEEFKKIANGLRNDYSFGLSTDAAVSKELADHLNTHVNTIVLVKKSEPDQTYAYDGDITQEKVNTFIQAEAFPLIGSIGPENFQKYLDRGLPLVWMFLDETKDTLSSIVDTATSVAKDFKGKFSMVKLDGVRWAEHGKHFGLKTGQLPGIVIEDRAAGKNYVLPYENGSLEKSKFTTWLSSWVDKTLKPTVKSAEAPANNDGPVKVIVGNEFDSIVMDDEKDVLVEFFAPWCGHCKQLAPKYEELGKMFADNDNVVVGAVDATENDTPASVKGFPTLIFYPAGDKSNPLTYNGERSAEALADFIRENGKATAKPSFNASDSATAAHDDEL